MKKSVEAANLAYADESKLPIVESDLSEPAAEEVQLGVEYSIVSGSDVSTRRGTYPLYRKPPLTPGYSAIGNPWQPLFDP
jgi:D-arabinose 1-dehydrogenase-like Zn-dependent alcohol dehydrogenase